MQCQLSGMIGSLLSLARIDGEGHDPTVVHTYSRWLVFNGQFFSIAAMTASPHARLIVLSSNI